MSKYTEIYFLGNIAGIFIQMVKNMITIQKNKINDDTTYLNQPFKFKFSTKNNNAFINNLNITTVNNKNHYHRLCLITYYFISAL